MRLADLEGRNVAVWGYGREGRAVLDVLAARLPRLTPTLICNEAEAASARVADFSGPVHTRAPDAEALAAFDVVVKSPGISRYRPEIAVAEARGTRFTSGTALWFAERPDARVVGITGTKGKSTTSAMAAHMARELGVRTALAGNIGLPLLELLDAQAELWVVELSSFQTGEAGSLEVGVVTSLYEEHLDWHGSRERYVADKLRLADVSRTLVVNATQPDLLARTAAHPRRVLFGGDRGWTVREGDLFRDNAAIDPSLGALDHLPGKGHNALNACAALTALDVLYDLEDARACDAAHSLARFVPLPHRLQPLGTRDGVRYIDDSISTTPQATLVALASTGGGGRITVIVGGHDRGLDWSPFVRVATAWPTLRIICQGGNGPRIASALRQARAPGPHPVADLVEVADLAEAVAVAGRISAPGDTVVLSPGAPSFDQFRDYAERGRRFAELAGFPPSVAEIGGLGVA